MVYCLNTIISNFAYNCNSFSHWDAKQNVMHKKSLCTFLFISVLLLITLAALFHNYYLGASEIKLISTMLFPLWLSSDITSRSVRTQLLPEIWTSWWNRWRRSSYLRALPVFDSDTKYQIWIAIMILIFTIIRDHVKGNFRYLLSLFW